MKRSQKSLSNGKFHDFPCPICDSKEYTVLYESTLSRELPNFGYDFSPDHNEMYRVIQCTQCTHAYSSPRPKELYEKYTEVVDHEYLKNHEQRQLTAKKVLSTIHKYRSAPESTLLDIGCATGDFLIAAQEYYHVAGLELSDWASEIAQKRGLKIYKNTLDKLRNFHADVVTLWGVIEHFEYPAREVREIHRILQPGGIVCLWTGNFNSWIAKLLGRKWWYMQGQHIQLFTQGSLDQLFLENQFEKIHAERYPYVMSLRSIAKSLERYPVVAPIARLLLNLRWIKHWKITLRIPGEMFAIYRKK